MRKIAIILACFLSAVMFAQQQTASTLKVEDITKSINFGHSSEVRSSNSVDIIVIHSNYFVGNDPHNVQGCISQFRQYKVSPHYMITRDGRILKMVDEKYSAWQAGVSRLPGTNRTNLNKCSIGIEIINKSDESPSAQQYAALLALTKDICSRHNIRYIVRHSDVAPKRKSDPWMFDWKTYTSKMKAFNSKLQFPTP